MDQRAHLRHMVKTLVDRYIDVMISEAAAVRVLSAEVPDWRAKVTQAKMDENLRRTVRQQNQGLLRALETDGFLALLQSMANAPKNPSEGGEN